MTAIIKIGDKKIGANCPVFIIAEAGVNHNGKLDLALRLVDAAAKAGANAIKFQTFRAENVVTGLSKMAPYQMKNTGRKRTQLAMLEELELKESFYKLIIKRCKSKKIMFLSTPHGGRQSVNFLESIGILVYKIGSGDLNNFILLDEIAKTKKPIIISTGMSSMEEIRRTIRCLYQRGVKHIAVMHCTTEYPCRPEEVNLSVIPNMIKNFKIPIGYSDHTVDHQAAIASVALGASLYECHLTLDKNMEGPDHIASSNPTELLEKIKVIREVEIMLGNPNKKPTLSELKIVKLVRKSIVYTRPKKDGDIIKPNDLEAKRPGYGVPPSEYMKFIGRKIRRPVRKDEKLKISDF
ncbi:MAG: N-acetylneuraminate synthase [Parcubacteria group bacterium Licking1014_17]|nr:MAG: N-acetylneuraminate synthase [Parcubacteria group bacterium Licking1014_17]